EATALNVQAFAAGCQAGDGIKRIHTELDCAHGDALWCRRAEINRCRCVDVRDVGDCEAEGLGRCTDAVACGGCEVDYHPQVCNLADRHVQREAAGDQRCSGLRVELCVVCGVEDAIAVVLVYGDSGHITG